MFLNTAMQLTLEDIRKTEKNLDIELPKSLVKHYLKFNGGLPINSFFYEDESELEVTIKAFLPIKYSGGLEITLDSVYLDYKKRNILPSKFLPFAMDHGSNKLCINLETEEVVIIWLDLGEVNEEAIRFLANSFDEFISNLEEEE